MEVNKKTYVNKGIIITGILALIYSLLPVLVTTAFMQHYLITFFLILLSFVNTGFYYLICWYANSLLLKILFIVISFPIIWFVFYRIYLRKYTK